MKTSKNSSMRKRIKEITEPRMARSARIAELNMDTSRISEPPSTTVPGTVNRIVKPHLGQPEKAQIAVDGADDPNHELRIENRLTDEHGNDVSLKKSQHVAVTVTAPKHRN